MFCSHCGAEVPEDAGFCPACGERLRAQDVPGAPGAPATQAEQGAQGAPTMPGAPAMQREQVAVDAPATQREQVAVDAPATQRQQATAHARIRMALCVALLLIGAILLVRGLSGMLSGSKDPSFVSTWPEDHLAALLPDPTTATAEIEVIDNTDTTFIASVEGFSEDDFEAYIEACRERGFVVEANFANLSYRAFDLEGHKLAVDFYRSLEQMHIELTVPKEGILAQSRVILSA